MFGPLLAFIRGKSQHYKGYICMMNTGFCKGISTIGNSIQIKRNIKKINC
jgi:hypothetical protein